MTHHDGRAMSDYDLRELQRDFFAGGIDDKRIARLIETVEVQRDVLRIMFGLFERDDLHRVSIADPQRNSFLDHLKERVSMENWRRYPPL